MEDIKILEKLVSFNTIKDKENSQIMDFIEEYLRKYNFKTILRTKNLVMINAKEDGFYSVGVDNYAVMYDNIRFLYEEKECRSFWFVMGPEENYENGQRTKALLDFAKKKKLKKNIDYEAVKLKNCRGLENVKVKTMYDKYFREDEKGGWL